MEIPDQPGAPEDKNYTQVDNLPRLDDRIGMLSTLASKHWSLNSAPRVAKINVWRYLKK